MVGRFRDGSEGQGARRREETHVVILAQRCHYKEMAYNVKSRTTGQSQGLRGRTGRELGP